MMIEINILTWDDKWHISQSNFEGVEFEMLQRAWDN